MAPNLGASQQYCTQSMFSLPRENKEREDHAVQTASDRRGWKSEYKAGKDKGNPQSILRSLGQPKGKGEAVKG